MGEINQEPSMEDILASIKRVIADDSRSAPARPARGRRADDEPEGDQADLEQPEEDVLELDDPLAEEERLISEDSAAASRQSLAALAAMRQANEVTLPENDGSLEGVVREMLRPMLRQWLDQRLPEIVEDMVSREIARITGKRL